MIKLKLIEKLGPLKEIRQTVPNFTVITGLNGVGKSYFLLGINNGKIYSEHDNGNQIMFRKYVSNSDLSPRNNISTSEDHLYRLQEDLWNRFDDIKRNRIEKAQLSVQPLNSSEIRVFNIIAKESGKKIEDLTEEEFFLHYPVKDGLTTIDIFQNDFSKIFKRYNDKLIENEFSQYLHEKKDKEISFLSDTDFIKRNGPKPWEVLNNILASFNLDYEVSYPSLSNKKVPFEAQLINKKNKTTFGFAWLSSGEKVMLSLALAMYNYSTEEIQFPELLLMDEPDASLHPSLIKQFLNIIQTVFVEKFKLRVIITTHSPTTVALAPDESLFVINKNVPQIEKISKDKALKILTTGVRSLSIDYENRRQIFVESKIDSAIYENIYNKLSDKLSPEVSLNFISSGSKGSGSSNQVNDIVTTLRNYGNKSIFGIIDWDQKNQHTDSILILGKGKRYSLENYIFDPLLLAYYLFREKILSRQDLNLKNNETLVDFKKLKKNEIEFIVNILLTKIKTKIKETNNDLADVKYINGLEIQVPKWYLLHNGHELEDYIKTTFPELKKHNRDGGLKMEMINKSFDDIPEFIPVDFLDLFRSIQEN